MGQDSYIYEAGCAFVIDGETTAPHRRDGSPTNRGHGLRADGGARHPELLFEHFEGRLEYHSPWHHGRVHSHLFRGKVDVDEANALLGEHGDDDLRLLDNGAIGTPDGGNRGPDPRLPPGPPRRQQGGRGRRPCTGPRLRPR